MKNAFTMIELIFVIVILGILGAVAIPKLSGIKDDAQLSNVNENICVNLKGNFMAYAARHNGSLEGFNVLKYFETFNVDWAAEATTTTVDATTAVISSTRNLIPPSDSDGTGTITPFANIPENGIYLYFLDGNMSSDFNYGCYIGNSASYSKTASELRVQMQETSNYL